MKSARTLWTKDVGAVSASLSIAVFVQPLQSSDVFLCARAYVDVVDQSEGTGSQAHL